jgi:DNA (cytosine-5)-methyltransferase 1
MKEKLKYLELFAGTGIGGIALDNIGCENIGYSEFDKFAIQNYQANFPNRINYGDITKINEKELPNFDMLIGGSPCTDISVANPKNMKGLKGDESCLFYDYIRILNNKLPKWFIFENVKDLLTTNNGQDWNIVKSSFEINYNIRYKIMNTAEYGVPQRRKRIYVIGQRKDLGEFNFEFPQPIELKLKAQDLLEVKVDDKYYLSQKMHDYVSNGNAKGFNRKIETDLQIACTLVSTMHKMHRAGIDNYYHTTYKPQNKTNLRKLMPIECARLQGLPDTYKIVVSDTQAYRLMGNAMSLNVVQGITNKLKEYIDKQ